MVGLFLLTFEPGVVYIDGRFVFTYFCFYSKIPGILGKDLYILKIIVVLPGLEITFIYMPVTMTVHY